MLPKFAKNFVTVGSYLFQLSMAVDLCCTGEISCCSWLVFFSLFLASCLLGSCLNLLGGLLEGG